METQYDKDSMRKTETEKDWERKPRFGKPQTDSKLAWMSDSVRSFHLVWAFFSYFSILACMLLRSSPKTPLATKLFHLCWQHLSCDEWTVLVEGGALDIFTFFSQFSPTKPVI